MQPPDGSGGRTAAAARLPDRIGFVGLGLIGGSVALALRDAGYEGRLVAWTPMGRGPTEALRRGIVDEAAITAGAAIEDAGLVVLAGPPLAIIESIGELADSLRSALAADATITDVGSTKGRIVAAAERANLPFVGGHPMAGRETTGVEAADAALFLDRPWVVVPSASAAAAATELVESLATATGARPIRLSAEEHDEVVAAISHLPLVIAAALVEAVALGNAGAESWPRARQLAASGWRDMTRLARGDVEMGAGILATNSAAVAARLRAMRTVLDGWIAELEGGGADPRALRDRLEAARAVLTPEQP
jgi:prephenate dehydrogenase